MKRYMVLILLVCSVACSAADIKIDVDTAVVVPVNKVTLVDSTDGVTLEEAVAYNAAGMDLDWIFVTSAGVTTKTDVTPTTAGDYDWTHIGSAVYTIEIPASAGASINNDTEGYGWFVGECTGVAPWCGPVIEFRAAAINDALTDGGDYLQVDAVQVSGDTTTADNLQTMTANMLVVYSTDFSTNYDTTVNMWNIDAEYWNGVEITQSLATASDVWSSPTRTLTALDEDNTALDLDGTTIGSVNTLTGHTPQTGDSYSVVTNVTYGLSVLEGLVDDLETRLTAVRAGYLDNLNGHTPQTGDSYSVVTNVTYGLSVLEGLVDDLETRLTSVRAGYLDNLNGHTPQSGDTYAALPTNFSSLVISAGGAVDALWQGVLNTLLTETTAGRIAGNLSIFWGNADAATTKTVDNVGEATTEELDIDVTEE